eukprot:3147892-Pyramimonas_sp.AAC.1
MCIRDRVSIGRGASPSAGAPSAATPGRCLQEGARCRAPLPPPPHCCPRGADRSEGPHERPLA